MLRADLLHSYLEYPALEFQPCRRSPQQAIIIIIMWEWMYLSFIELLIIELFSIFFQFARKMWIEMVHLVAPLTVDLLYLISVALYNVSEFSYEEQVTCMCDWLAWVWEKVNFPFNLSLSFCVLPSIASFSLYRDFPHVLQSCYAQSCAIWCSHWRIFTQRY